MSRLAHGVARTAALLNGLSAIQTSALVRLTATRCRLMSPWQAAGVAWHDARALRSGDHVSISHALLRGHAGDAVDKIILVGIGMTIPPAITIIYLMVAPI